MIPKLLHFCYAADFWKYETIQAFLSYEAILSSEISHRNTSMPEIIPWLIGPIRTSTHFLIS